VKILGIDDAPVYLTCTYLGQVMMDMELNKVDQVYEQETKGTLRRGPSSYTLGYLILTMLMFSSKSLENVCHM